MKEFKFGTPPTKTVQIDEEGNITVQSKMYGSGEYNVEKIKEVFLKKPTVMGVGSLYLSFTGNNPLKNPVVQKNGFQYTRKQEEEMEEFISLIHEFNEELEIKKGKAITYAVKSQNEKVDKNAIRCPKCKSINIEFLDNKRKGFSAGKAIGGAALTGGIGALAGFAGKKGKDRWHCRNCGAMFDKKS